MKDTLKEREWEQLVYSLGRGTCVLLLGPGVDAVLEDGEHCNLAATLALRLSEDLDERAPETATLSHVAQRYFHADGRASLEGAVERFFEQHGASTGEDPVFTRLAALPFQLILTTRFDRTLDGYLRAEGKEPVVRSYDIQGENDDFLESGTTDAPLVYHLFGDLAKPSSLIITEEDIVRFFEAVVAGNPEIPPSIRSEFAKPGTMFFLVGFGIQRWYTRILLNVLGAKGSKSRSFAVDEFKAFARATDQEAARFFQEEFRIDTLLSDGDELLATLSERWAGAGKPMPNGEREADATSSDGHSAAAPGPSAARVFLSYVREDEKRAESIFRAMRSKGLDAFWDQDGLRGGDRWEDVLEREVAEADYFVVLQSRELVEQDFSYVHTEVSLALEKQSRARSGIRFIYPLLVDEVPPLAALKDFHSVLAKDPSEIAAVVDDIAKDYQLRLRR